MGPVYTKIRLEGALEGQTRVLELSARVDPDVPYLCLPASVVTTLGLTGEDRRIVATGAGEEECRYVGPLTVQCTDRTCFTGAVEAGNEVVLGSICLDALGMILDEETQQLITAPLPPNLSDRL